MTGYHGNGRPRIEVYGGGHSTFTVHPPTGIQRNLGKEDVVGMLTSYPTKPVLEFPGTRDISGVVKNFFRNAIENMPLEA